MAKIEIGGKQIEVGDEFLSLSPEQQASAVDEIYAAMVSSGQIDAPPPEVASSLPGPIGAFQDTSRSFQEGATQGMTLGFADEIGSAFMTPIEMGIDAFQGKPLDVGRSYNQALERSRAGDEAVEELNPLANVAGKITGNMFLAGRIPSFSQNAAPTIGSMAGRGALDGLIYGGITGVGEGETSGERIQGGLTGGALGGALGGAFGGVAGALANRAVGAAAPTAETLGRDADAAYSAARQSGAIFNENTTQELVDGMALAAQDARINDLTAPLATGMLNRLQQRGGQPLTVGEIEDMRVFLNQLRGGADANEARVAGRMIGAFDDLMADLRPTDFAGGDAAAAMGNIAEGRRLFQTQQKTRLIEDTIQRATDMSSANYSASGFENALRQQFKGLLTRPNALNGFTDAERDAIRQVASGGPIENVLRYIGKLAPTGVISGGIAGGAGYALGGIPGAAAVLGAGTLARQGATASTLNNATVARALIAGGGQAPAIPRVAAALAPVSAAAGAFGGGTGQDMISRALIGR
jgi:hypothetical protein